ncbi:phage tail protein [Pseudomonas purpurea]|uniref:phage tail protein n=1 Tax=Pseudomonas purpurea TaxID=3136737 RepID=UPI0032653153
MYRYARVETGLVTQVLVTDQDIPSSVPSWYEWVDVTGNPEVDVHWQASFMNGVWTFTTPSQEVLRKAAMMRVEGLLGEADRWSVLNPLQFKADVGVATPADEALLLAYKLYVIAVSEVSKQPGYPVTISWPVAPW